MSWLDFAHGVNAVAVLYLLIERRVLKRRLKQLSRWPS